MAWRLKNVKLDPYWANAVTELADRTITRPVAVRTPTAASSMATTRRVERSSPAAVTCRVRSFARTTFSRGAATTRLAMRHAPGSVVVASRGPPAREGRGRPGQAPARPAQSPHADMPD